MRTRGWAVVCVALAVLGGCDGGGGDGGGDSGGDDGGPPAGGCPARDLAAPPIEHAGDVTADETWAAGSHLIVRDTAVRSGATLTIAPCAVVAVRSPSSLTVWQGGALVAEGTAAQPIRFESETPGGTWRALEVDGTARFAHVSIDGAGAAGSDALSAALWIRGVSHTQMPHPIVRVDHVTITRAPVFGVRLDSDATFTADSDALTVTGAGRNPVYAWPGCLANLPAGQYTGNAVDEIFVTSGTIEWDMTLRDLGVPYHVGESEGASVRVMGPAIPLLTIEPGVVLRFERAADLEIEHFSGDRPATGALVAVGTAARPIVFTSAAATPAAGDWTGIFFDSRPDPRDRVENVVVEYAGRHSGSRGYSCTNPVAPPAEGYSNNAGIAVMGVPSSAFIRSTTISHSAGDGIERGWTGGAVDFTDSNTFLDIAWCRQSFPRPIVGGCPDPVPCPR
jgi:hypothetical protein